MTNIQNEKTSAELARYRISIAARQETLNRLAEESATLFRAIGIMEASLKAGGKILVFGNGGSATQSSHFAAELVNKFYFQRQALAAIALTTDIASITSIANDMAYNSIFSRQLECLGKEGDIAVGITTSGTSANVLEALREAKRMKITTIVLSGANTLPMEEMGVNVVIPVYSKDTPLIQEMHLFMLHTMAELLEKNLGQHQKDTK
ncbi:MAG: SIS domain-containing protein [bacterium]|nr:SIS domain-containing protein [bacterium]